MPSRIARTKSHFHPPAVAGQEKEEPYAQKISRPHDLHAMASHAVSQEASDLGIDAQHQSLSLLARLRRRALRPRVLVSGSRMLLAAAFETADHRRGVAGAHAGRVLDVAIVGRQLQGLRGQKALLSGRRVMTGSMHHDRGIAAALALDQAEQGGGIARIEPHAAMRDGPAETGNLVGAVDGVAAREKDRVRHRRIVVFARVPAHRQPLRMIGAGRGDVAAPRRRHPPAITRLAVDDHFHALTCAVDMHDDGRCRGLARGEHNETERSQHATQTTHDTPNPDEIIAAPAELVKSSNEPQIWAMPAFDFYSIGHSNIPAERFVALLRVAGVSAIADVRSTPVSRFCPWFTGKNLKSLLERNGMDYLPYGSALGGRPNSPDLYCDGIADYEAMARQGDFQTALERLGGDAARRRATGRICLMCAEREPLDCHRCLLVARALAARGFATGHIRYDGTIEPQAATEQRLLELGGAATGSSDLFATGQLERIAAAYRRRARAVAYRAKGARRA